MEFFCNRLSKEEEEEEEEEVGRRRNGCGQSIHGRQLAVRNIKIKRLWVPGTYEDMECQGCIR